MPVFNAPYPALAGCEAGWFYGRGYYPNVHDRSEVFGMRSMFLKNATLIGLLIITLTCAPSDVLGQKRVASEAEVSDDTPQVSQQGMGKREKQFTKRSRVLSQLMSQYMRGGGTEPVAFDINAAREAGIDEESIELARQMVAHTNALLEAAKATGNVESASIAKTNVTMEDFPAVDEYFQQASLVARSRQGREDSASPKGEPPSSSTNEMAALAVDPFQAAYQNCGVWWNPLPTRAAPWVTYTSSNPDATLRSWGYHGTPSHIFGGGYTRAQTYMWWICGFGTFRDHAVIFSSNQFREQNYAGWRPRGEPNPEVYASGPWPYPLWPSYVSWWHQTH